jgi:hypothetical protein
MTEHNMNFMQSVAAGISCAALLGGAALADDKVLLENTAPIQSTAIGWWRPDLSKEEADAYWRGHCHVAEQKRQVLRIVA